MTGTSNRIFSFSIDENNLSKGMNQFLDRFMCDVGDVYNSVIEILESGESVEIKSKKLETIFDEDGSLLCGYDFPKLFRMSVIQDDGTFLFNLDGRTYNI